MDDADFQAAYGPVSTGSAPSIGEWLRYCIREPTDGVTVASRKGSEFVYDSTSVTGPQLDPITGKKKRFEGDTFFYIQKQSWKILWTWVPRTFVVNTNADRALNLEACNGRVNLYDWWGWPAKTLYMTNFKVIPKPSPTFLGYLRPGLVANYVDVEMNIEFFDPPRPCVPIVQTTTGVTSGTAVITGLSSTGSLYVGQVVVGVGFKAGTVITAINSGTQVTVSNNFTGTTGASTTLTFVVTTDTPGATPIDSRRGYDTGPFPYDGLSYALLTDPGGSSAYRYGDFGTMFQAVSQS